MATESGTKDKFFMSYVAQLQEAVNEAREQQKTSVPPTGMSKHDEAKMLLEKVRMTMPANLFSPVLRIPGALREPQELCVITDIVCRVGREPGYPI